MGKLLPILLAIVGISGGVGAGLMLRPAPEEHATLDNPCGDPIAHEEHQDPEEEHTDQEYMKQSVCGAGCFGEPC